MIRIGHGFDVHKFGGEGPCMLGGVPVPYEQGLLAHYAQALDLFGVAIGVVHVPGAGDQLRCHITPIGDGDGVGEDVLVLVGCGLVGEVFGNHFHRELVLGHGRHPTCENALSETPTGKPLP